MDLTQTKHSKDEKNLNFFRPKNRFKKDNMTTINFIISAFGAASADVIDERTAAKLLQEEVNTFFLNIYLPLGDLP